MPEVITLTISDLVAARLSVLIDDGQGQPDLEAVLYEVIDHVQQGIYRPGAWERSWVLQMTGDYWLDKVEGDPDAPVFDRPRERGND